MQEALRELGAEGLEFLRKNGLEVDGAFASSQRVAEAGAGSQGRGAGGQNAGSGKMVGCELEEIAGVCQSVDFIEDDSAACVGFQKSFCILGITARGRKFAIEEDGLRNRPRKGGLPNAPRCCEPNHRALTPGFFYEIEPMLANNHVELFSV